MVYSELHSLSSTPNFHPSPPPFAPEETTATSDQCAGFVEDVKPLPMQSQSLSHPLSPPSETGEFDQKDIPALDIGTQESAYSPRITPEAPVLYQQVVSPPYLQDTNTAMVQKNTRICRTILTSVQRHESGWPFKQPVDPILVGALNYFEVIKSPMDLSTISKRLAHAVYGTVQEFAADFRLMLDNCYTYNPPTHDIHKIGRSLDAHIKAQFAKYFPDITTQPVTTVANTINFNSEPMYAAERKKRNIRPPKVYEPDDIPARKHRLDDTDDFPRKKRFNKDLIRQLSESEGPVGPELISTLTSAVQSLQEQIAHLQRQEQSSYVARTVRRTSPVAKSTPSKPRRKGPKQCSQCKTLESKVWRSGPLGRATLCDPCGLRYSAAKKSKVPLTYTEKTWLASRVGTLTPEQQTGVIDIIQKGNPIEGSEIELDFEKLDQKTMRELYEYVVMQNEEPCAVNAQESEDDSDSGESSGSESD